MERSQIAHDMRAAFAVKLKRDPRENELATLLGYAESESEGWCGLLGPIPTWPISQAGFESWIGCLLSTFAPALSRACSGDPDGFVATLGALGYLSGATAARARAVRALAVAWKKEISQ
jgi:hypothetical protein